MKFFETSEEVVIYMKKKKRLQFLRTQWGSTLSLTNASGSLLSSYAFISKTQLEYNYYRDEPNPEYEP